MDRPVSQEVLYRKWRPRRFADVVGQDPVVTTLRNAVAGDTPAHAYLFTGPRGTGKTSVGRILAKALNCPTDPSGEPLPDDPACLAYDAGRAIDLIELDAASNRGIDEVRALRESVGYAPNEGRYKVYLIDEVHMLTDPAFNALLKTLEEPPPHVVFVLATTEPHRIPATITSRCQRFDFRRITIDDIVARLETIAAGESVETADDALRLIARQATGSLRDAVNLLDQLLAFHGRVLDLAAVQEGLGLVVDDRTRVLARASLTADLRGGLVALSAARDDGLDIRAFVREVVSTLRQVLLLQAGAAPSGEASDAQTAELQALAADSTSVAVVHALRTYGAIDFAGDPYDSLPAEIAFAGLVTETLPAAASSSAAPSSAAPSSAERTAAPAAPAKSAQAASAGASAPARPAPPPRTAPPAGESPEESPRAAAPPPTAPPETAPPAAVGPEAAPIPEAPAPPTPPRAPEPPREPPPNAEPAPAAPETPAAAPSDTTRSGAAPPSPADAPPANKPPAAAARPAGAGGGASAFEPPDAAPASEQTEQLRAQWDEIRTAVRRRSMRAGAMLNSGCYIKAFIAATDGGDDTVELGFRFPKHVELVQSAENGAVLAAIREVMTEVVGHPLQVVPIVWEELQSAAAKPPASQSGGGHLLDEAKRLGAVAPSEEAPSVDTPSESPAPKSASPQSTPPSAGQPADDAPPPIA